jgi:MFS family permease
MAAVTAINVALPQIRRDFGIGFGAQQWIMLSYSLALASLYLVAGALDDRLGRRRMFIVGTAGFALASSLGGIAPSPAFSSSPESSRVRQALFLRPAASRSCARRSATRAAGRSESGRPGQER